MNKQETILLAGGCFWCMEAVFSLFKGVISVTPGYTDGKTAHPTYSEVCTGLTHHAEAIHLVFDPDVLPLAAVLDIFFSSHNPTTLNQQGGDIGTQYRSGIYTSTPDQTHFVKEYVQTLSEQGIFPDPIVTEIKEAGPFYPAEGYHHEYFKNNPTQPYCQLSIGPKVNKIKQKYHLA